MTANHKTVREIALENPTSIRVFEQFGIDYCCGGRKPLAEACAEKNVALSEVEAALSVAGAVESAPEQEWAQGSLAALARHIVEAHHSYVKRESPRLIELAERVVRRHGDTKPELLAIQSKVAEVADEMTRHMAKEELILFPHIASIERAIAENKPKPQGCFGSIANPIAMMTKEHDTAGALVSEIHQLSNGYTPPAGACPTFHAFYNGLREFEVDLHRHVHLENNILFPRAMALEESRQAAEAA